MGADPVTIGLITMAAGSAVKAIGGVKANRDQAAEERENAAYYREQALFAEKAGLREEKLFAEDAETFYKNQIGLFARNGVRADANTLGETIRKTREQINAIREETAANVRLAYLRGQASDTKANRLSSFGTNALETSGTLLSGAGNILSRSN